MYFISIFDLQNGYILVLDHVKCNCFTSETKPAWQIFSLAAAIVKGNINMTWGWWLIFKHAWHVDNHIAPGCNSHADHMASWHESVFRRGGRSSSRTKGAAAAVCSTNSQWPLKCQPARNRRLNMLALCCLHYGVWFTCAKIQMDLNVFSNKEQLAIVKNKHFHKKTRKSFSNVPFGL